MSSRQRFGVAAVAFVFGWAVIAWLTRPHPGELLAEQDLPADVQAEVDAVWDRFTEVFAPRLTCFDDVSLLLVESLPEGDARYLVEEARIEILIPTSPRRFRESLAHELAHHVEHGCDAFSDLRGDFIGLPDVGCDSWFAAERWQETPSEQWAETVVLMVNGERVRHAKTMALPDGGADLVSAWAAGSG